MLHRLLTLLLSIFALTASAQEPVTLWLDYCNNQYKTTQNAIASAGDVEVAIRFSREQLAKVAGNEVSRLSMAFPTTHPTTMTLWLRSDRDGENLREIEVTKIASKWNTYELASPLPITGEEEELWVGATFNQKYASSKYLSMAGETHVDGCHYRVVGEPWTNKAGDERGSLCIRMGVTGENIPQHDLSLSNVHTDSYTFGIGNNIPFTARVANHGADDAVNPIVRCTINGQPAADVTLAQTIAAGQYSDVTFNVPTDAVAAPGIATFGFEILWADGLPDRNPANNTDALNLGLVNALHDMALVDVAPTSRLNRRGSNITVTGTIRNNHYIEVVNPQIAYSINGTEPVKKSITTRLGVGESAEFSFSIPTKSVTEDGPATIDLELLWRDGSVDDSPADNKASLAIALTSAAPNRRMLVEEGTGTWCGWCVRGIVGLHDMAAKYPDRFIGIAGHSGDFMQCAAYVNLFADLGINGYPGCFINREPIHRDPNFAQLESYMKSMPEYCDFNVDAAANITLFNFDVSATITPLVDIDDADLRVVFAITEDDVNGEQANYYSGGGQGVMGGYEKLGSPVSVDFADVARGLWPDNWGDSPAVHFPSSLKAGQSYTIDYSIDADNVKFKKIDKCNVVAIIIDGKTDLVANAAIFRNSLTGINTVLAPTSVGAPVYNLNGQRSHAQQKGISIQSGRKVVR